MQQSLYHNIGNIKIELFLGIALVYYLVLTISKLIILTRQRRIQSFLNYNPSSLFSFKVKSSEVFYLTFMITGLAFLWAVRSNGEIMSYIDKTTYYLFILPFFLLRHAG